VFALDETYFSPKERAARISLVFLAPIGCWALHEFLTFFLRLMHKQDTRRLEKLKKSRNKMIMELKALNLKARGLL